MSTPDVFAPAQLGPVTLRNRIIKAATFEGMSPEGVVSDQLIEFHRAAAAGGIGMTTVSYVAVSEDGRGAPNEIHIHEAARPGLERIASVVHGEGAAIAAQLGHAGPVGTLPDKRVLGPSNGRTVLGAKVTAITKGEIDGVVEDFARGATMLADTGFDSVEIHLGHGYLPSSFMSPKLNKRTDEYGGSLENRARLPREIAAAVRAAVGTRIAVTAKMNMRDGIRGGLEVLESVQMAKLLEIDGHLDALELTAGSSQQNPMYLFHGDVPRNEFAEVLPGIQKWGFKVVGRLFLKEYPYTEMYFLPLAEQFRRMLSMPLVYLGGVNSVESLQRAMNAGFQFVAMGRAVLRQPDLIRRMQDGQVAQGNCIHCNKCMISIYSGTRCVVDHPTPLVIG